MAQLAVRPLFDIYPFPVLLFMDSMRGWKYYPDLQQAHEKAVRSVEAKIRMDFRAWAFDNFWESLPPNEAAAAHASTIAERLGAAPRSDATARWFLHYSEDVPDPDPRDNPYLWPCSLTRTCFLYLTGQRLL